MDAHILARQDVDKSAESPEKANASPAHAVQRETPDELIDYVSRKKLTLISDGHFLQYPPNRESVTFIGHIKETSEEFLFRIYDREYFLYLLKRLRIVKKESAQEQINIKS